MFMKIMGWGNAYAAVRSQGFYHAANAYDSRTDAQFPHRHTMKTLFIQKSHHYHVPPNAVGCPGIRCLYTLPVIVDMLNANGREAALVVMTTTT